MHNNIVYLTGFMGAGKSTIGPILANTIGWDFLDLDKEIEKQENKKVKEIFNQNGEEYFRQLESRVLISISSPGKKIISLGGGTIVNPDNLSFINNSGVLVYLKTNSEVAFKRLQHKRDRPAIAIDDEENFDEKLKLKISELMAEREKYYIKAKICIETSSSSIGGVIDKLVAQLKHFITIS